MNDKDQQLIYERYQKGHLETYSADKDKIRLMGQALVGQFKAKGKYKGLSEESAKEYLRIRKIQSPFLEIFMKTDGWRVDGSLTAGGWRKPIWTFYATHAELGPVLARHGRSVTGAPEEWHIFTTDPETIRVHAVSLIGLEPGFD